MKTPSTRYYTEKVVICGDTVEHYRYSSPIAKNPQAKTKVNPGETDSQQREQNREHSLARARKKLRRLVQSNVYQYKDSNGRKYKPVFLTLTFAENVTDLKQANHIFGNFLKRLNYKVQGKKGDKLHYVVVPEFQKRGAVHYHVIFFNMPYMPVSDIAGIWGQGFVKLMSIDDVTNVGAYVCKYLTKDHADTRLEGNKCFWGSRGLLNPLEITGTAKEIAPVLSLAISNSEPVYNNEFTNPYLGVIMYTQYRYKSRVTS